MGIDHRPAYRPGLDGLRAIAVIAVLCFHARFRWARGGFLGVSVFFTLSGFLITSVLLAERHVSGRISLRAFWSRRVRRLAPAALLCLLIVLVAARWWFPGDVGHGLRADAASALGNVANWRFLAARRSYADLFVAGPSPLLHFWSLAIEEQCYFVVPIVVAVAGEVGKRRAWVLPLVLTVLTLCSIGAALATRSHDLVYYGTHTRAAELLIGALLAVVVQRVGTPHGRVAGAVAVAGVLAAAGFGMLVATTDQRMDWLYRGGFALLAIGWCVLVLAAIAPGPVRAVLATRPLVAVGRLSYGIYLFHWPVFVFLTADRLGADGWRLHATRVAITLILALVSYHFVEQPVRRRRVLVGGVPAFFAYGTAMAVLVIAVVAVRSPSPAAADDAGSVMLAAPVGTAAVTFPPPSTEGVASTTATLPRPFTIAVVGDDTGVARRVAALAGRDVVVDDRTSPGCAAVVDATLGGSARCATPDERLSGPIPDVVVLAIGAADRDVLVAGGTRGVPRSQHVQANGLRIDRDFADLVGRVAARGAPVMLVDSGAGPPATIRDELGVLAAAAAASVPGARLVRLDALDLGALRALVPTAASAHRLRVMVIGDSVSYGVAVQMAAVAPDRFDVVWAGGQNCPIVDVSELRWWADAHWTMDECPSTTVRWPETIASFRPDAVLLVASLPEQAEQRYGDDPAWYVAGTPRFTETHDAMMRRLLALLSPTHAVVVVATAAAIASRPFSESQMGQADRVAAWNAQIASWQAQHPDHVGVLDLAGMVVDAERAAGRSLRADSVHLTDEAMRAIIHDRLASELTQIVNRLRATPRGPAPPR